MTVNGERWDLVVAGAGPAGCSLAAKVASGGSSVLVLDSAPEPGSGRSWIVDVGRNTFAQARVPEPDRESSWNEPERQVMVSSGGRHDIELPPSPVRPVRNDAYVRQLAAWASSEGACLRAGCTVLGPLLGDGVVTGVTYAQADGSRCVASARIVADCTGIAGAVRRGTPGAWGMDCAVGPSDTVLARREVRRVDVEAAGRAIDEGCLRNRVRVDRLGAHGAYSTETVYLDLNGGYIDILVGVKADAKGYTGPDERFRDILSEWPFVKEKLFGDGGTIPIRRTLDSLVGDGLMVLGDSACQVIPAHGSGTASALIAADLASRTALRALEQGRFDRAALWDYSYEFMSGRGAVLAYYYAVRKHSETLSVRDIDSLVQRGVLAAEEIDRGLVPEPFRVGPGVIAHKVVKGVGEIGLLAGFARAGLVASRFMKHYRRYPRWFSEQALEVWSRGVPRSP